MPLFLLGPKDRCPPAINGLPPGALKPGDVADVCASFQGAVEDVLEDRTNNAIDAFRDLHGNAGTLVVAGGVAANKGVRARLDRLAQSRDFGMVAPPLRLCTDNGVMIAWAGIERLALGLTDGLDFKARPRWPLDPDAPPAAGAGIKA